MDLNCLSDLGNGLLLSFLIVYYMLPLRLDKPGNLLTLLICHSNRHGVDLYVASIMYDVVSIG